MGMVDDFVLAQSESDAGANGGQCCSTYRRTAVRSEPAQVFVMRAAMNWAGIDLADVNGDGLTDLLYGIRLSDGNGANSGY